MSRDVGGNRQRAAAALLDLGGDVFDELHAAAGRDDVGARVGQSERERAADAARTTNDDGRAAGQIKQFHAVQSDRRWSPPTRARRGEVGDATGPRHGRPSGPARRQSASAAGSCAWCRLAWSR